MKHLITMLACAMLYCTNALSQDISKLDRKNGFKNLTIGDSLSKYQPKLKYNTSFRMYEFKGSAIKIGRYTTRHVGLNFDNSDKLFSITIFLEGDEGVRYLHQQLLEAYGEGVEIHDEQHIRHVEWVGRRIQVILTKDVSSMGSVYAMLRFVKVSDAKVPTNAGELFQGDL